MQIAIILTGFIITCCTAQNWSQLQGSAVDISAKGNELWSINSGQNIYRWNGKNWDLKVGSAVRVGASPDGWTWVVNKADEVYRWNLNKQNWDKMPGALVQISAISKDRALGVNRNQNIFLWENNAWTQLPGLAIWAAIGDGDERWVVNKQQSIFRWNHSTNTWDQVPGAANNIDVQNPCRVIATNAAHQIYIWKNNNWQLITGSGTRSTITEDEYYTVNSAQQIWVSY